MQMQMQEQVPTRRVRFITGPVEEFPIPTAPDEDRTNQDMTNQENRAIRKQLKQMQVQMLALLQKHEQMQEHMQKQDQTLEQIIALLVQVSSVQIPSVQGSDTYTGNMEPMFVRVPSIPIRLVSVLPGPSLQGSDTPAINIEPREPSVPDI